MFGSQEGPAKLNTPGKAELGPAGNAVLFRFGRKRRGKMLKKGAGVPGVCLGLGPGLAPFPGGSGVGAGRPSASLALIYTQGRRAGATHTPHRPRRPLQTARPRRPEPRWPNSAPRRAFESKKWDLEKARAVPTAGGGHLSSLMLCCFPAPGKQFFYPFQPGLDAVSDAFFGCL